MPKTIVDVKNLDKSFRLPHEKTSSIKSAFVNGLKRNKTYEEQRVLKSISFDIKEGEFFGIVGRNGSGKSTLLKLLAGIYAPDKGSISVYGKLTPFIELGVGFNPDLTGRENVYLNGALLGFSRTEVDEMYQEIVDFAEIERFMDQRMKNYSSGMQVRLAFSIAIRARSDILLLDEVLAVGDEAFQRKCIAVFEKYKANKQTVILVTHDMSVVEKYCDRAILIHDGDLVIEGSPRKIAHQYSKMNSESYLQNKAKEKELKNKEIKLKKWSIEFALTDAARKKATSFDYGETAFIDVAWEETNIKNIGVALLKESGEYVFGANTVLDAHKVKNNKIRYALDLNLEPGTYEFKIGLFGKTESEPIEFIDNGPTLIINNISERKWGGVTNLNHKWE